MQIIGNISTKIYLVQGGKKMKAKPFSILLLVCVILTCCNTKELYITSADDLMAEFKQNIDTSTVKYRGKLIKISGVISYIARPKDYKPLANASMIAFGYGGFEESSELTVECYFDTIIVRDIQEGDSITILAEFDKYFESSGLRSIVLRRGRIVLED